MEIHSNDSAAEAFRAHRHDVLNALQLVRAYIQLNRPEDALRSVDALASWLQSLGSLQNQLGHEQEKLLWLFIRCPHVEVSSLPKVPALDDTGLDELKCLWNWLEEQCATNGFRRFSVDIHVVEGGQGTHLQIRLKVTEEMESWWNNIHSTGFENNGFGRLVTLVAV